MRKAFTLIEILTVTAIIIIFTSLTVVSFGPGRQTLALIRSAHKVAQDIRKVSEMALSAKEIQGTVPPKYGLYFEENSTSYIIFADDGDNVYESGEEIEEVPLESKVKIRNSLTITFEPPDPTISISGGDEGTITLFLETDPSKQIEIKVNVFGLIDINP